MEDEISKKIVTLYTTESLSAREIAEKLGITMRSVYYNLAKSSVPRRSPQEQNRISFIKKPLSFSIKQKLSSKERDLFILGLSMYWCEGFQTEKAHSVDFANSNPKMITLFVRFLKTICQVDKRRLRCYLYCYSNQNVDKLISYWSKISGISREQFTKPYVRSDYRLDKINKMPYGLLHIRYSDKKLLIAIRDEIELLAQSI